MVRWGVEGTCSEIHPGAWKDLLGGHGRVGRRRSGRRRAGRRRSGRRGAEPVHHRRQLGRLGEQPEVAAVVDVQLGVGQQAPHDAGVEQRDDGVVVAGEQQCRLPDPGQQRQAAPAGAGGELVEVAAPRAHAAAAVQELPRAGRVRSDGPAVEVGGDPLGVVGIQVPAGGGHPRQDLRPAGHHQRARAGGGQDQPSAAVAVAQRELLGQATSPGDPQHVHGRVAQLVEEAGNQARQSRQPVGHPRQR